MSGFAGIEPVVTVLITVKLPPVEGMVWLTEVGLTVAIEVIGIIIRIVAMKLIASKLGIVIVMCTTGRYLFIHIP